MSGGRWGIFSLGGDQWESVGVSGGRWGWELGLVKPDK